MPNQALKISQISIAPRDLDNGCGNSFNSTLVENSPIFLENSMKARVELSEELNYFLKKTQELMSMNNITLEVLVYFEDQQLYQNWLFRPSFSIDLHNLPYQQIKKYLQKLINLKKLPDIFQTENRVYRIGYNRVTIHINCLVKKINIWFDHQLVLSSTPSQKFTKLSDIENFFNLVFNNTARWWYDPEKQAVNINVVSYLLR